MENTQQVTEKPPVENGIVETESEVEAPVTQEAEAEGRPEAKPQQKQNGGNLQAALKEERERRKQLQQKMTELEEKQTKFNQRMASLFSDEPEAAPAPKFEENPAEYLKKEVETTKKTTEDLQGFFKQQRAMQELQGYAQSSVQVFKKETPDYDAAYEFARKDRIAELMEMEECTEAEALAQVNQEEINLTIEAAKKGQNPAKKIYAFAKRRGYKSAESGEGGEKVSEAEQAIDRIQKGQASAKSLSNSAGKSTGNLTMEKILSMSEEEYSEFKSQNGRKLRQLMGETAH